MTTRNQASAAAASYYSDAHDLDVAPNDLLDPRRVADWIDREHPRRAPTSERRGVSRRISVDLVQAVRPKNRLVKVLPVENGDRVAWIDVAGFPLATSEIPRIWRSNALLAHTFRLSARRREVTVTRDV